MKSRMRGVSQIEPSPTVAVTRLGLGQLGEDLAHRAIERLALLGQHQAARMTMEQRRIEALLERADLPADRGLAQAQLLAGMGEAASFGHRVKHPQLVPIHMHLWKSVPARARRDN